MSCPSISEIYSCKHTILLPNTNKATINYFFERLQFEKEVSLKYHGFYNILYLFYSQDFQNKIFFVKKFFNNIFFSKHGILCVSMILSLDTKRVLKKKINLIKFNLPQCSYHIKSRNILCDF